MDPLLQEFLGNAGNEYPVTNKADDEIKKLTIEEDMSELKRAMHILSRGQSFQKISVYRDLHNLLCEPDSFSKLIPLVSDGILSQTEEIQIEIGKSFIKMINSQELQKSQFQELFRVAMAVVTVWNMNVLDTWVLVFHEILKKVPYNSISFICEAIIVNFSEKSQHPTSKYAAARMIGFIAEESVKPTAPLFDKARFLCQDSEIEVRKIMAIEVILKICRHVGKDLTETKYIEKILELAYDSNSSVKLAAIDSLIETLDILSTGYKKDKIVPVLVEMMNSVNEEVIKKMSFLIGKIIHKLEAIILEDRELVHQIESIIKEWTLHQNIEVKKNLVYNVPYLLKIFAKNNFLKELYINAAAQDSGTEIRLVALSSFHEVTKILSIKEAQTSLREIFENILKEEDLKILEKVIPHLGEFVPMFQAVLDEEKLAEANKEKEEKAKNKGKELSRIKESQEFNREDIEKSGIMSKLFTKEASEKSYLEDLVSMGNYLRTKYAWRLEVVFIQAMNTCLGCFDLKSLEGTYVNFLFKVVNKAVKDVTIAAINSLILYLKRNHYSNKTNEIMKKLVTEFQESPTFQHRLAFLEFYSQAAENFSRLFFKTHGLHEKALELSSDKVVEVKKKFLENATLFKRMVFADEKEILAQFNEAIARISRDQNKFISQLAKSTSKDLKLLTPLFFEDFLEEDAERTQQEERLKEKEKEELEMLKRKQQEELFKSRPDNFHALTTLLMPTRKPTKKMTWHDAYSVKPSKNIQSATTGLDETPKSKLPIHPTSLPTIKSQKAEVSIPQKFSKDIEIRSKPKNFKITSRPTISPMEPKKKTGSFSLACKERPLNLGAHRGERRSSKERSILTEPSPGPNPVQGMENRVSKLDQVKGALERIDRSKVRVPTIRKKN